MAAVSTPKLSLVDSAKRAAAYQAVNEFLLPEYKFVGIGSGSTVVFVVEAIVSKGERFYQNMVFIPTGSQSKGLIRKAGLRYCNLNERPLCENGSGNPVQLDVVFDGADEVDENLNLIKGGGACLLQEKLVAISSKRLVAVAGKAHHTLAVISTKADALASIDYRKHSKRLCTQWKYIPIEVLPLAAPDVIARLRTLGSPNPTVRSGLPSKAGECVTDNGMWIIDAPFPPLLAPNDLKDASAATSGWEVSQLAEEIIKLPGVVETGLFYGFNGDEAEALQKDVPAQKPVAAFFGMEDGSVQVVRAQGTEAPHS